MDEASIRVNKYLANLGICARRDVKNLLKQQNLQVNGKQVTEPGERINPYKDTIVLNGKKIKPPKLVYYLLNKPKGIISTTSDEFGRDNVTKFIPTKERIYPVGRLDKDTTGLLILTNDGTLTNHLTHPKYHVDKTYALTIHGSITREQLRALRNGVLLDDGITAPAEVTIIKGNPMKSLVHMTIHEGRNRQIRRMCGTVGVNLIALKRIAFGPIKLVHLKEGQWRELTQNEISLLQKAAQKQMTNQT